MLFFFSVLCDICAFLLFHATQIIQYLYTSETFQVQKQILEDLVHAKIIGFFTEWCNTEKVETCGFGYLDVTVIYKDDKDVKPGGDHWEFVEDNCIISYFSCIHV